MEENDSAGAGEEQRGRAPAQWETYPLALGRVLRSTHWPEAGAVEWLRQQAIAERVTVRFAPAWQYQEPTNRRREALRPEYEALGHYGPGISDCAWFTPLDNFNHLGPPAMARGDVQFTEWHAGDLSAALSGLQMADEDAQGARGRKPDWPWADIVAEVAISFALAGGLDGAEVLTATVQDVAERMTRRRPSRSRAQTYAQNIRAAWERRAENAKN
jgi:hypothetical protein